MTPQGPAGGRTPTDGTAGAADDDVDRRELVRYARSLGATPEEVRTSPHLGELALDLLLRPRSGRTLRHTVEAHQLDWQNVTAVAAALGLPLDPDTPVTDGEAATVVLFAGTGVALLGEEATIQLARVTGSAVARLAETVVGCFRLQVQLPRRDSGTPYSTVVKEYGQLAQSLLPAFVRSVDALLRRQIVSVTERVWSTDEERSAVTLTRTVGFVDMVGYTSATGSLSVRELTRVLMAFDTTSSDIVQSWNGQIVKTIGDEAMFVCEDAADACRIALDLVEASADRMPALRVGLAQGEMVSVFGDLYGPDVNLAARLVSEAEAGTAVVSEAVTRSVEGFEFRPLPPLRLKGFPDFTTAYRVLRRGPEPTGELNSYRSR